MLHVYDTTGTGFPFLVDSRNPNYLFIELNSNAPSSLVGIGMYRQGGGKAFAYINSNNNYVLNVANHGEQFVLTPSGNVGIGQTSPGFPLNFASTLGDKISLYGNSGNNYGLGIQQNALQIYTDNSGADIVLGYGRSGAFTENMRIQGNSRVGIGTNNPFSQLHVYDTTNTGYPLFVESNNATASVISVGSKNSTAFVGTAYYRGAGESFIGNTVLNASNDYEVNLASHGNIFYGKSSNGFIGLGTNAPQQNLSVNGGMNIDQASANAGTASNILSFGSASGEGIGSRRTSGGNQYGIDFYTNFTNRLSLNSNGKLGLGVISPTSKLEVRAGGVGVSSSNKLWEMNYDSTGAYFYIDEFGAARRFTIKNGGNVGIGTTNPTVPLDVAGNIKTTGNILVQTDKSVIRSNTSVPQKLIGTSGFVNITVNPRTVTSLPLAFEAFSAPPLVTVGNITNGTGDFAKVVVTVSGVTNNGCTVNFYNPAQVSITFSGTFNFALGGAQ